MTHIHLDEAFWCENCQCFIDSAIRCPSCATESNLIPMAQFMPLIHQTIVEISTPIHPLALLEESERLGKMACLIHNMQGGRCIECGESEDEQ